MTVPSKALPRKSSFRIPSLALRVVIHDRANDTAIASDKDGR